MKKIYYINFYLLCLISFGCTKPQISGLYRGSIGLDAAIVMELQNNGEEVSGNYYYEKIGKSLKLKGQQKDGVLFLEEYNQFEQITGNFSGVVKEDGYSGKWSNPSSSVQYIFDLKRIEIKPKPKEMISITGAYYAGTNKIQISITDPSFINVDISIASQYCIMPPFEGKMTRTNTGIYVGELFDKMDHLMFCQATIEPQGSNIILTTKGCEGKLGARCSIDGEYKK